MTPEDQVRLLVRGELNKCIAPISNILVATAILTDEGVYLGHNIERENPVSFEHAEKMALDKILEVGKEVKIKKIIMAGGGKVDKHKFYTPCYPCCMMLYPYMDPETEIVLLSITGVNKELKITFKELFESYEQLPYSKFESTKDPELTREIQQKTVLTGIDIEFIRDLALLGISNNVSFYLTGSASGRGGVSTMLNQKTNQLYRDIDILAIIPQNFEKIEKEIENLINYHYRSFDKQDKPVPNHHNKKGVVFRKTFYYCGDKKDKLIDFTFSTDLIGTLTKNEYEVKNWFHQLS